MTIQTAGKSEELTNRKSIQEYIISKRILTMYFAEMCYFLPAREP